MENYQLVLSHHGIKGMRWGIRRFQRKDGSLTSAGKRRYGLDDKSKETIEERRARVLNSTNASEIYKNRNILTTAEINERLNRIDTERRLKEVSEKSKKTGFDYVDRALKVGRKINEVYEFTNTPVMKALKKKLGLEKVEERLGLDKVYEMRDKLSDKQLQDALRRATTEKSIKRILDESKQESDKRKKEKEVEDARAKAQKEVDDYNERVAKGEAPNSTSSTYSKSGSDVTDSTYRANTNTSLVPISAVNNALSTYGSTPISDVPKPSSSTIKTINDIIDVDYIEID